MPGERQAEWPSARLTVHDTRTGDGRAVADLYSGALAEKPPPNPAAHDRVGFLRHVKGILLDILGGSAIWLDVRNAKSNHSEEYGLPGTRAIGLECLPPSGKLAVFCAAVMAARADAAGSWAAWCRRINTRLGRLAPDFGFKRLTFYSFRHDFIERAKAALRPEEVAALAGHCSADSKGSYGRPNMRGKRLAAPAIPDPEHVRILDRHFEARREAAEERNAAARQLPAPSPGPSFGCWSTEVCFYLSGNLAAPPLAAGYEDDEPHLPHWEQGRPWPPEMNSIEHNAALLELRLPNSQDEFWFAEIYGDRVHHSHRAYGHLVPPRLWKTMEGWSDR